MKSDSFVDDHDGSGVGLRIVIFCLKQIKLEELDRKKNSSLKSEPQLLHSDEKNFKVSFFYAEIEGFFWIDQIVQNAIEKSLMVGQSKISTAEQFSEKVQNFKSECCVAHLEGRDRWQ